MIGQVNKVLHAMSKNKRLQGELSKAINGHFSYELKKAKASFLPIFLDLLVERIRYRGEVIYTTTLS